MTGNRKYYFVGLVNGSWSKAVCLLLALQVLLLGAAAQNPLLHGSLHGEPQRHDCGADHEGGLPEHGGHPAGAHICAVVLLAAGVEAFAEPEFITQRLPQRAGLETSREEVNAQPALSRPRARSPPPRESMS